MNKTRQARLLVIDVDGTLLTTDYQLTKATCSAVQQVSARGVQVVLASARSPRALHAIMGALGIMGLAICYSGALTCRISPDPHRPSEVVTEQHMNLSSTHMAEQIEETRLVREPAITLCPTPQDEVSCEPEDEKETTTTRTKPTRPCAFPTATA